MSFRLNHYPDFDHRVLGKLALVTVCFLPLLSLAIQPAIAQTAQLPDPVAASVKQDVAKTLQISADKLKIVSFTQQNWPDGCLNLPKKDEICTQAIVPGWRVEVTDGAQQYFYRTDSTGKTLRAEGLPGSSLPLAVAQRVQQFAARELKIDSDKLKIAAIEPRVFDGCLGIFTPNRACTKIAIQGWQAVISNGSTSWLYHLDRDGRRIVQNPTASGALAPVAIGFVGVASALPNRQVDTTTQNLVFSSTSSGDITGQTITTTLTTDGKVIRSIVAPNIRSRPVVIRTLLPQQVEKFLALVLIRQRFANLNRLTYLTEAAVADVPTIALQDATHRISYISTEKPKLPKSLRAIIDAWEKIIAVKK